MRNNNLSLPAVKNSCSEKINEIIFSRAYKEYFQSKSTDQEMLYSLIQSLDLDDYVSHQNKNIHQSVANILAVAAMKEYQENRKGKWIDYIKLLMPVITVVISFFFVTWIGGKFQEDSFDRNVVFKAQLERFQMAESLATEIAFDIRDVSYRIEWDKSYDINATRYRPFVSEKRKDLERLQNNLRGFPEKGRKEINTALLACIKNIDNYLMREDELDSTYIDNLKEKISDALIQFLSNQRL